MYVELGKIVGVWGVKGWIKLHSYTRNRADIASYPIWWLQVTKESGSFPVDDESVAVDVLNCREQGPGVVAQIKGVDNRDQAAALIGQRILVRDVDLPVLPKGEYYWQQLIGLAVSDAQQSMIGRVASIIETGANDVLVVESDESGTEDVLVPYTDEVVKDINIKAGTMVVDWDADFLLE